MKPDLLLCILPLLAATGLNSSLPAAGDKGWIQLFNGEDLTGWHLRKPDGPDLWWVENQVYTTAAKGTDLQTDKEFYNFQLHVEFKIVSGSNSGVYMRDRYEIQIADSYGKPPGVSGCGGAASAPCR